ncbi:hypothetical protein SDC9_208074 [bioreactor metagenome]|uniref:Uncharacterized protein n=1 Tax=bioreactor metagenome TaxID=1076179 RepID=A0A645JA96_9ZZZZ
MKPVVSTRPKGSKKQYMYAVRCSNKVYENGIGVFLMRSQDAADAVSDDRVASIVAARQGSI